MLATALRRSREASVVAARDVLQALAGETLSRAQLQIFGRRVELDTQGEWLADAVADAVSDTRIVICDSARTQQQTDALTRRFSAGQVQIHLVADERERRRRFADRQPAEPFDIGAVFEAISLDPLEHGVDALIGEAELVVDTTVLRAGDVCDVVDAYLTPRLEAADRGRVDESG
jgi:hypothetical protein